MKKMKKFLILITVVSAAFIMTSCDDAEGADAADSADPAADTAASSESKDAYDDYIRSALASVDQGKNNNVPAQPSDATPTPINDGKAITTDRGAADDLFVSSMEEPDGYDPFASKNTIADTSPTVSPSPSPTVDPNATPTPTPTPYITPEEFDVGKCCIYINGESDSAGGTEVVTAINKARKDLGYKEFVNNKSLATCADRRTREVAALYSHQRPNGQQFYSLAPEHFKAEMLIITGQKAEEAVDAVIKNDPISRNLIFTEKYQSIGASSFKCNGIKYTVVAFGL